MHHHRTILAAATLGAFLLLGGCGLTAGNREHYTAHAQHVIDAGRPADRSVARAFGVDEFAPPQRAAFVDAE